MTKKKTALIWVFLLVSLTMVAYQSPQFQAQPFPNQAVVFMVVSSTPPLFPSHTPNAIVSPLVGAQQWLKALNMQDDDQIQNLTCQAQKDRLKESSGWVLAFPALAKLPSGLTAQLQGTVSGLRVEIIRYNAERARLRVYGNLVVSGSGVMAVYAIDERWWMVYEDGVWQWCGISQGEATPTLTPAITSTPLPMTRPVQARSSSSPSLWQVLGVFAAILGAVARIYSAIQRKRDDSH